MSLRTGIELQDNFSDVLSGIIISMNEAISTMSEMQQMIDRNVSAVSLTNIQDEIASTISAVDGLQTAIRDIESPVVLLDVEAEEISDLTEPVQAEVEAVVTERPEIDMPDIEIDNSSIQALNQQIQQTELLFQRVSAIQRNINNQSQAVKVLPDDTAARIQEINAGIEQMHQALNMISENPFHMDSQAVELQIVSLTNRLRETLQEQQQLQESLSHMDMENEQPPPTEIPQPEPVEIPIVWQTDTLEVFTDTGIDRFEQEVESANSMLEQLYNTQDEIARQAHDADLFSRAAFHDLNELAGRIDTVRNRMQQIANNPINMGADEANAEIEQLRSQLDQAIQEQNELNAAMENMDVSAANTAYARLSQTIANTERYIRDNVDEQGQFNNTIEEGVDCASNLNNIISRAVGIFAGVFGISKVIDFVSEGMENFDSQLNAETQLMSVLANMLDDEYVTEYMLDVNADTSKAIDEINTISDVDDIVVTVDARVDALQAEFDAITAKADEISSKGIYGGDTLIAGAAELSTYFTDTDAIEMMMDTLSDYAMGMSGGGEVDNSAMVEYATGLGKIMSGAYDAMTKKGFEFTDTQQAIIEGTATEEQIVAALGEEYLDMSEDMQAAAAITQVIDESWAGLYETMSDTPEGKIIQMTNAWGDMKQMVAGQLYPYIMLLVDTILDNWGTIETIVNGFTEALQNVLAVIGWLIEGVVLFASFVTDNWSLIEPIVMGIVAALAVYAAISTIVAVINGITAASEAVLAAKTTLAAGATFAETAAQHGLNAALAACPLTWIILLVIALIAVIYALCQKIAEATGIAQSRFGVITGSINVAIEFVKNLAKEVINTVFGIHDAMDALSSNIKAAFHNAISSVQSWFYDLLSTSLTVIEGICEALNKLPFIEFDYSGVSNAADKYAEKAARAAEDKKEYENISDAFDKGYSTFNTFQDGWVKDAFHAGADWGDGVAEAVSSFNLTDALGLDDELDDPEDYKVSAYDYAPSLDGIGSNLDDIADDTDDISDSLEISEENLKYLRDLAEQETVNRFTTAEITIEQNNTNNISSKMDLDGVISGMTDAVNEAISIATEGVH